MATVNRDLYSREDRSDALNAAMTRGISMNWQVIVYLVIFALAIFTRFYALGDRAMSHDESLHTYYSYELATEGEFNHTPLMHGPILFHANAFFYTLFGDNDFTARIYAAVLGVALVMTPLLFRRWLGRWGTILAATMILISPLLLYYNRYIRHDTPSILSAVLMVWAFFMYLNGPENQRRRAHWLYLIAAAMIWNLGSKETAFIYIAIFGLFLTLYWIARMAQRIWNIPGKIWFYGGSMAVLLAGVAALGMYIILDITPAERIAQINPMLNWFNDAASAGGLFNTFIWMVSITLFTVILTVVSGALLWIFYLVARLAQQTFKLPGGTVVPLFAANLVIAIVLFMGLDSVINIFNDIETRSFLLWSLLTGLIVGAVAVGTMLWALRGQLNRLPWREMLLLTLFIAVVLSGLIVGEEFSHINREAPDEGQVSVPVVPGEDGQIPEAEFESTFSWLPVLIPWIIALIVIPALFYSRSAGWWDWLDNFPELDILIVMGALILPWLTAVFIVAARGSAEDFTALGTSFNFLSGVIPLAGPVEVGQFIVGILAWIPMMAIAMVTGLVWNWKRFLVCFLIFHAIFAFFFTTMFTNIIGLASGMIYSLQYWLEQQAERRGNQPQYYYLLIIMPMYEFLPIIGGVLAMLSGSVIFWRRRATYNDQRAAEQAALAAETASENNEIDAETDTEAADVQVVASSEVDDVEHEPAHAEEVTASEAETQIESEDSREVVAPEPGVLAHARQLVQVPFLLFVSWWAVLNLILYTLAGEKMPWLGTHLTIPLIFLTAWYFGGIFDRINFLKFRERGWIYLLLVPFLLVTLFQVVAQPLGGEMPFAGAQQQQLQATNNWIAALLVSVGLMYGVLRLSRITGRRHMWQMVSVSLFAVLSLLTFRAAVLASFVNYDDPTEFLVYAHATRGTKVVMDQLEELSVRTTDGMDLSFAYDSKMSWPGVWYFREYNNEIFMGDTPSLRQMEQAVVVLVGEGNRSTVEPLLEDRYQRFDYKRMWWPMMDYFGLTANRIINTFDLSGNNPNAGSVRRGIFDIWWSRDYTRYGQALDKDFALTNWPVSEDMHMYVRRDIAAQVWPYGLGDGSVVVAEEETVASACVTNWQDIPAVQVFQPQNGRLNSPIGLSVDPQGRLWVAEDGPAHRLSIFDPDGTFVDTFGQQGTSAQEGAFFERPHSLTFGDDGRLYVVDTWNYMIRSFDAEGEPLASWGSPLTAGAAAQSVPVDGFWGPREVALDSEGNVYVADTGNKRVRVYDANGNWLRDIGTGGSGPGQLDEPTGIVVHPDGRVFVADTWNRRISVFLNDGTFLTTYDLRAWYDDLGNRPYLALDDERNFLYVTDPDAGRVLVYDIAGECIGAFGRLNRENPTTSQFSTIGGITLDDAGNVYVVDMGAGRVLKFPPFVRPEVPVAGDDAPVEGEVEIGGDAPGDDNALNDDLFQLPSVEGEADPEGQEDSLDPETTDEVEPAG